MSNYTNSHPKVQVVAFKDKLVFVPFEPEKDITLEWWPTGGLYGDRLGCVLGDSERMLGVSNEALRLMKKIPRNNDSIGDIDWWLCDDGKYAFSWFGSIHRVIHTNNAQAPQNFVVKPDRCRIISNELPEEAIQFIDKHPELHYWNEMHCISYNA